MITFSGPKHTMRLFVRDLRGEVRPGRIIPGPTDRLPEGWRRIEVKGISRRHEDNLKMWAAGWWVCSASLGPQK